MENASQVVIDRQCKLLQVSVKEQPTDYLALQWDKVK